MTHVPFLIAAFSVFALVLAADAFGSWLRLRNAKRDALRRQERQRARSAATRDATPGLLGPADVEPGSARLMEPDATGRAEPGATELTR
jgi:heme exporter protein D